VLAEISDLDYLLVVPNSIAIIIPLYNEEARFDSTYFHTLGSNFVEEVNFLFVDDGSTDLSYELARNLKAQFKNMGILRLAINGGKAEAIRSGFLHLLSDDSNYDGIGYLDSDGAFDVRDFKNCIESFQRNCKAGDCDAVFAARLAIGGRRIKRSRFRHFLGRLISYVAKLGLPNPPWDTQAGLKIFSPSTFLIDIFDTPFRTRWLFEIELLQRYLVNNRKMMNVWEEPLLTWVDKPGSKLSPSTYINVFISVLYIMYVNLTRITPLRLKGVINEKRV